MVNIPKEFQLLGHTITIKFDNVICKERGCFGFADYNKLQIILADEMDGIPIPESLIIHTYTHEKIHFILYAMGEDRKNNEKFVDLISGMIYQSEKTAKYES